MLTKLSKRVLAEQNAGGAKVWGEITKLASGPNIVVDLGQGYPDFQGSRTAVKVAAQTMVDSALANQYSLIPGTVTIRKQLSSFYSRTYPRSNTLDPEREIVITTSGTEAINSCIQALIDPGDEIVIFEPFFPWYVPCVRMAGGICKTVKLKPPDFCFSEKDSMDAISPKTKMIIHNSPHNPTGHVSRTFELEALCRAANQVDAIVVSDEVYEAFTFGDCRHVRICDLPRMRERTITIGSASKMFSLTGWRVGWAYGPEDLISAVKTCHSYSTYCAPRPLQVGIEAALASYSFEETQTLCGMYEENARRLGTVLAKYGVSTYTPEGGYFLIGDVSNSKPKTDVDFCKWLATEKGVVCVPLSVFYLSESAPSSFVRFSICKERETIDKAIKALGSQRLVATKCPFNLSTLNSALLYMSAFSVL